MFLGSFILPQFFSKKKEIQSNKLYYLDNLDNPPPLQASAIGIIKTHPCWSRIWSHQNLFIHPCWVTLPGAKLKQEHPAVLREPWKPGQGSLWPVSLPFGSSAELSAKRAAVALERCQITVNFRKPSAADVHIENCGMTQMPPPLFFFFFKVKELCFGLLADGIGSQGLFTDWIKPVCCRLWLFSSILYLWNIIYCSSIILPNTHLYITLFTILPQQCYYRSIATNLLEALFMHLHDFCV